MTQIKLKISDSYLLLTAEYDECTGCYEVVSRDSLLDLIRIKMNITEDFIADKSDRNYYYNLARYMYVYIANKLGESIKSISRRTKIKERTLYYWQQEGYTNFVHNKLFNNVCKEILGSLQQ